MRQVKSAELGALAADMLAELEKMQRLAAQVQRVKTELETDPASADFLYDSCALKLHNFYTGCERIFQLVANELNGGLPAGSDWHRRLLDRMKTEREGRPAVISTELAAKLAEYLGFRHAVRRLYGYELEPDRIDKLMRLYPAVWQQFEQEIQVFIAWLEALATRLENR